MNTSPSPRTRRITRFSSAVAATALCAALAGCGITVPADPGGTLAAVSGGTLRVGTSPDDGLVGMTGGEPSGSIVDLVEDFADSIDAETEWTVDSEETLVTMLEAGDLDLIAGGITAETPWLDRAGVSRGHPGIDGADGREIVMLVPLGENAFLSELETFLDAKVGP
ncbi:transporter substrate-binding domain-containing protein [Microbacterium sp. W4I20]|uniref:transporter substrate-binding domain-containing protein n=1 Tax=Microbacterium sp. W4I20 TaxID=3042262 RepID=UPI0027D8EA9D|nr:transporter substrate-binding domain-containing protein [Microbacterium sp. W4I20]